MSEPIKCEFLVFRGSYFDPPEYCPNDAESGLEYCADHIPWEPDPDNERDWDSWSDDDDFWTGYEGDLE